MRRCLAIVHHYSLRSAPAATLRALAPLQPFSRSAGTKQNGLDGVTVTRGSAAVKQAVAQQRWVVGDANSFKKCDPCEQGGKPLDRPNALALLQQTPEWTLADDGLSISRTWQAKVTPRANRQPALVRFTSPAGLQERRGVPAAGCGFG